MKKTLVAYFSATGTTELLAKRLATLVNGDLFAIVPEQPYTEADLNWMDLKSRSSVEMKNKTFRPKIANKVKNMEDYDRVFLGFPIWWYVAPTIIHTFLQTYDWKGKTIIPFATSGGSGMGKTNEELATLCEGAVLKEGKCFDPNVSTETLQQWVLAV